VNAQNTRPWREIAEDAHREQDPKKLIEFCRELSDALDEQQKQKKRGVTQLPQVPKSSLKPVTLCDGPHDQPSWKDALGRLFKRRA